MPKNPDAANVSPSFSSAGVFCTICKLVMPLATGTSAAGGGSTVMGICFAARLAARLAFAVSMLFSLFMRFVPFVFVLVVFG